MLKDHRLLPLNFVEQSLAHKLGLAGPYANLGSKHLTDLGLGIPSETQFNPATGEFFERKVLGKIGDDFQKHALSKQMQASIEWPHEYHGHYGLTSRNPQVYGERKGSSFVHLEHATWLLQGPFHFLAGRMTLIMNQVSLAAITQEYYAFLRQRDYLRNVRIGGSDLWTTVHDALRENIDNEHMNGTTHSIALSFLENNSFGLWKSDMMEISHHTFMERQPLHEQAYDGGRYGQEYPDRVLAVAASIDPDDIRRCRNTDEEINLLMERLLRINSRRIHPAFEGPEGECKYIRYFVAERDPDTTVERIVESENSWLGAFLRLKDLVNLLKGSYIVSSIVNGNWQRELYFDSELLRVISGSPNFEMMLKIAINLVVLRDRLFIPLLYSIQVQPRGQLRVSDGKISGVEEFCGLEKWFCPEPRAVLRVADAQLTEHYSLLNKTIRDFIELGKPSTSPHIQ